MPTRPKHPCNQPGCAQTTSERFCDQHAAKHMATFNAKRGSSSAQGYGGRWRLLRKLILNRDPYCKACKRAASTEVDHVVAKRNGGSDSIENLQGLCKPCHSAKTARETLHSPSPLAISTGSRLASAPPTSRERPHQTAAYSGR